MTFTHNGVLVVYTQSVTEAITWWRLLYDSQTPCIIWKKGEPEPWAAYPLSRLLEEIA